MAIDTIGKEKIFEYTWDWFVYHARQRLEFFRFFLIFLGLLVVAFSESLKLGYHSFTVGIPLFISFVSLVFLMQEIRSEQLVNIGRDAIREFEREFQNCPTECRLLTIDKENRKRFISNGFWYKVIYVVCVVIFLILAIFYS